MYDDAFLKKLYLYLFYGCVGLALVVFVFNFFTADIKVAFKNFIITLFPAYLISSIYLILRALGIGIFEGKPTFLRAYVSVSASNFLVGFLALVLLVPYLFILSRFW